MDPSEVEFLGEKRLVSIEPKFALDATHLISGSVGPFRPGIPVKVPLWLALDLRQQQKCRIVSPDWMNDETLDVAKEDEKREKFFTRMPSDHFMDEAQMILGAASDDIPNADSIRTAIKDLWDIRMSKLRTSIDTFLKNDSTHAKLDHLTVMEIANVRPLLPHALDQILRISGASLAEDHTRETQGSQSQNA